MFAMVAGVYAQGKPNFAGKWTRDMDKSPMQQGGGGGGGRGGAGGGGGQGGGDMTITQDATSFTIERNIGGNAQKSTYKFDGEGKNMGGRDGSTEIPYKAKSSGGTVTIETTQQGQNGATTTTTAYAMEGDSLVITTTRPGRDGGPGTPAKVYYKKAS